MRGPNTWKPRKPALTRQILETIELSLLDMREQLDDVVGGCSGEMADCDAAIAWVEKMKSHQRAMRKDTKSK